MQLKSSRLRLEPLEAAHAEPMFEGLRDERLYEFISESAPRSVESLRTRYLRLEQRKSPDNAEEWLNWALWSIVESCYVGYVQATVFCDRRSISVAYVVFHSQWGKGYGTEGVRTMISFLQRQYGDFMLTATVDSRNCRSSSLLHRLGFIELSESDETSGGLSHHEVKFALPKNAWFIPG